MPGQVKKRMKPGPKARLVNRKRHNFCLDEKTHIAIVRLSDEWRCSQSDVLRRVISAIVPPASPND